MSKDALTSQLTPHALHHSPYPEHAPLHVAQVQRRPADQTSAPCPFAPFACLLAGTGGPLSSQGLKVELRRELSVFSTRNIGSASILLRLSGSASSKVSESCLACSISSYPASVSLMSRPCAASRSSRTSPCCPRLQLSDATLRPAHNHPGTEADIGRLMLN